MRAQLRAVHRLLRLTLFLVGGLLLTLRHGFTEAGRQRLVGIRRRWFQRGLVIAGIRLQAQGTSSGDKPALVVANHVSWLDIPVIGSRVDVRFLSKAEVTGWPVIGWLARRNGTLFIRRGEHHTDEITREISAGLSRGERVVIFPEATTTRGDEVRRFHPRLMAAALAADAAVLPIALDYGREADGSPSGAAFTGDDRLLPHAWRILCREQTEVCLHILPEIPAGTVGTRRELADAARQAIVGALGLR